ncbi:PAS domain-containing protein, partial [Ferrovibrio sp.]|uniref:PAS domain-containing protein n=1 Tax=Ferrovibrio sp. TaxID=1917215 RepID=UPI0025BE2022
MSGSGDGGVILVDVIDPQGIVVWVNQAQCELSGQLTQDVIGKPLESIYTAESAREIRALLANPPQDARLPPMELALRRPNGRSLPVIAAGRFRRLPTSDAWELQFNKIDFGPMARRV